MSATGPAATRRVEPPRRQMMATAIDCFARHGYQGTSIDRIARAVGRHQGRALLPLPRQGRAALRGRQGARRRVRAARCCAASSRPGDALRRCRCARSLVLLRATVSGQPPPLHHHAHGRGARHQSRACRRSSAASCAASAASHRPSGASRAGAGTRSAPTSTPAVAASIRRRHHRCRDPALPGPRAIDLRRSSTRSSNSSPPGLRPSRDARREAGRPEEATRW